mmetsp:Transcript_16271/g.19276  ORF Transcript_16271/g.19276 Transcript_16271/m.19276 type:complete len:418 (+) Transcript_16271:118-1371(+)
MTVECQQVSRECIIARCEVVLKENPENRCCKYVLQYLATEEGKTLKDEALHAFTRCIKTGIQNPDSSLGCYAMTPTDYAQFGGFFDKVIRDYHGDETGEKVHVTDWDTGEAQYDVKKLGLDQLSMRVRVGRNLIGFNLPGKMSKEERITFEKRMLPAFDELIAKYGGKVNSITPDFGNESENPNLISAEEYKDLVGKHVMFKDMSEDSYLRSAGISNDWPYGRGCWQSEDKMRICWYGEEDQLRIMCMKDGNNLLEVFHNLKEMLTEFEKIDGIEFAKDERYGYITSCPSNLGTGMRASVHIRIPNLTADGTDEKAKQLCKPLGLSVRGVGGEHTPIGSDGTVDISPSSRLFIKESEIISKLYKGILILAETEKACLITSEKTVTPEKTITSETATEPEIAIAKLSVQEVPENSDGC